MQYIEPTPPKTRPSTARSRFRRRPQTPIKLRPLLTPNRLSLSSLQSGGNCAIDTNDKETIHRIIDAINDFCDDVGASTRDHTIPDPNQNSIQVCLKWIHQKIQFIHQHRIKFILTEYEQLRTHLNNNDGETSALLKQLQQADAATRSLVKKRDEYKQQCNVLSKENNKLHEKVRSLEIQLKHSQKCIEDDHQFHTTELDNIHESYETQINDTMLLLKDERLKTMALTTSNEELLYDNERLTHEMNEMKTFEHLCNKITQSLSTHDVKEWNERLNESLITTKAQLKQAQIDLQHSSSSSSITTIPSSLMHTDKRNDTEFETIIRDEINTMKHAYETKVQQLQQQLYAKDRELLRFRTHTTSQ